MNNIGSKPNFFIYIENMAREPYAIEPLFMSCAYGELEVINKFMLSPVRSKKGVASGS